jgi:hypothetical protein
LSGDESAGREIVLAPFAPPPKAVEESKESGFWKLPEGAEVKDGKIVITQGAMARFTSVPVESKEFAAFYLISPDGEVSGPESEEVKISAEAGAVEVPTAVKVEKVEEPQVEESAIEAAREEGVSQPVLATELLKIYTKSNQFESPVTFTLKYDPEKVSGKLVLLSSEDGKRWSKVAEFSVDPNNPYVSFARKKLSYFALVGSAPSTLPGAPSQSSSGGGGGGCSISPSVNAPSGALNLLTLLSGLGALLFRRRRS